LTLIPLTDTGSELSEYVFAVAVTVLPVMTSSAILKSELVGNVSLKSPFNRNWSMKGIPEVGCQIAGVVMLS
jgi:hypothetical protein